MMIRIRKCANQPGLRLLKSMRPERSMNITKGKTDEFETGGRLVIFRFGWSSPPNPCLPSCFHLPANPATGGFDMIQVETISNQVRTGTLDISWSDGKRQQFTHAFLRSQCQCTECKSL